MASAKDLVHKLMSDVGLRERLHHEPDGVLKEYTLTPEEKAAILSVGTRYGFETPSGTVWRKASQLWW